MLVKISDRCCAIVFPGSESACNVGSIACKKTIGSHADQRSNRLRINDISGGGQGVDPRPRMGVITIDQRSVDVEERGRNIVQRVR